MPYGLLIVGAGPGGLAPLFAAARYGKLPDLFAGGVLLLDQSLQVGAGQLEGYGIPSDSPAEAFLDAVVHSSIPELRDLTLHPTAKALEALRGQTVPLAVAAQFLAIAANRLCDLVRQSPGSQVLTGHKVLHVQRRSQRVWEVVTTHGPTNERHTFRARSVHLATGAHQPIQRLQTERVGADTLLPRFTAKVVQSGELFAPNGAEMLAERLRGKSTVRVAIVGGSTSAGAVAVHLLRNTALPFSEAGVTLLHRSPLRLFYASADEAHADGYDDFQASDVCRLSGRVYRLSGFRFEAKQLLRDKLIAGGPSGDPRLQLVALDGDAAHVEDALQQADVIVAAMGYRPRMATVLDEAGDTVLLHQPVSGDWAMVDQSCCVLTRDGDPLPGLTAMGLAIGPAASHELGGEANYRGQVNSLWLWQNTLGLRVVDEVIARAASTAIPLIRPMPPAMSMHADELRAIERSNTYSNFGPVNTRLERDLIDEVFQGSGHCVTTCNATLGLMLAIRDAIGDRTTARYALMPSFTFAAAAQAALWCGLTPLYCDIDPGTWLPSKDSEEQLLSEYAGQIAVVVPNATFGNSLDVQRYEAMADATGVPVVVDAASSLGSLDQQGMAFGRGSSLPIVFSMHATKPFATGEGGLLYCSDERTIRRLRAMSSFGFGEDRVATMPGLNAKMSEVAALTASLQLKAFPQRMKEHEQISRMYANALHGRFEQQVRCGQRQAHSFQSVLLPSQLAPVRGEIVHSMRRLGVTAGHYFSPHLAQQPYLRDRSLCPPLPVTEDVASRILSLPMFPGMSAADVATVVDTLMDAVEG